MSKSTAVLATFVDTFALAITLIGVLGFATGLAGSEPVYRLDATYHHLPPKLVAALLTHPPKRPWLGPNVRCETEDSEAAQIEYCICFGLEACAAAPHFHPDPDVPEVWVCTSPLGVIDDRNTMVCRAHREPMVVVG
jgi:hypothetical protein